jgi:hypothetical protein
MASGQAGGAGRLGRSLNATVPRGLQQAGRETGVDPALIEAWCELGYVVTEGNRHLFSAGDILAWEAAVGRHADNVGDEGDLDGEDNLDEDLR